MVAKTVSPGGRVIVAVPVAVCVARDVGVVVVLGVGVAAEAGGAVTMKVITNTLSPIERLLRSTWVG